MSLLVSIDGACRRNGKPDCTASGGVFIMRMPQDLNFSYYALSAYEYSSTNQRGELLALLTALDYIYAADSDVLIVTDSEYLFNAMTKQWHVSWQSNGWKTRDNADVKNKDIWIEIAHAMHKCEEKGIDIVFYHIKGHCIPFGKVTADNLLARDPSGESLFKAVYKKFDDVAPTKEAIFEAAQQLSIKNNGYRLDDATFKTFVVANVVADAIATKVVENADSFRKT